MALSKKIFEEFAKDYKAEEQDILVLLSDQGGSAGKLRGGSWSATAHILAYQDLQTGEVKKGDGRIVWPVSDKDLKKRGCAYPHFLKQGGISKLRVRGLADRTVPEGHLPHAYNRFLLVKVLKRQVKNEALAAILEEYRKPIVMEDTLGSFTLNKDYSFFEADVQWLGKGVTVFLEVDIRNEKTWEASLNNLRALYQRQEEFDGELRRFAAEKLTDTANDWLTGESCEEITPQTFARRIQLATLSISEDGDYTAYFSDDDMFGDHSVTVYGNIQSGAKDANIEG